LKLNLGCGRDVLRGYVNVDLEDPCDLKLDLSKIPWPWETCSVDEILMLDFLEHFSYRKTDSILQETWRVLKTGCFVDIQVPDFEHCSMAALDTFQYLCNFCGASGKAMVPDERGNKVCRCGKTSYDIADAAIKRLYGGQDRIGNWHFNAFTKQMLEHKLKLAGFGEFSFLEKHHQWINWNFKIRAVKQRDAWD